MAPRVSRRIGIACFPSLQMAQIPLGHPHGILLILVVVFWSQMINWMLPADSRPGRISFPVQSISPRRISKRSPAELEATPPGRRAVSSTSSGSGKPASWPTKARAPAWAATKRSSYQDGRGRRDVGGPDGQPDRFGPLPVLHQRRTPTSTASTANWPTTSPWARSTAPAPSPAPSP